MSKIFVDQVDPKTATTLTLGTTGDTVDIPTGVTLSGAGTITASAANLAASGAGGVTGTLPIANGGTGLTTVPYFLVEKTSNQTTVVDNVYTQVTYESEIVDNGNNFASNTFTAPVTGYYYISANISISGTGYHCVSLFYKNDGGLDDYGTIIKTGGGATDGLEQAQQNIGSIISLAANDTVKVYAKMNTTGGTCTFYDGSFSGFQIIG